MMQSINSALAMTMAVMAAALMMMTCSVMAQHQHVVADRTSDALVRVRDLNGNGVIDEPAEVFLWFNAANAAATPGPLNPTTFAISGCRVAIMGDQDSNRRLVLRLHDVNHDGDAQDVGESLVFAGPGNSAGASFAFPTGAAFDSACAAYVVNASNALGPDAVFRLVDLNGDADAMDQIGGVHEITLYVGVPVFGDNSAYSPQELFFDAGDVGYLRNSSAGLHGIYRFEDLNNNQRADDPGEFTVFLDTSNASGVTVSAGFALEPDRLRSADHAAMYTMQVVPIGIDQIIRAIDLNDDGDAQDAGEAALVWSNPADGFTGVDLVSLANGDLLVSDNSANTIVRLRDLNGDGDFMDANEQGSYLANTAASLAAARQFDRLCRTGDVTCDGVVNVNDLLRVINAWGGGTSCGEADVTCDGNVNVNDVLAVINSWG